MIGNTKNILITGATGFLGGYLLKRILDEEGMSPVVLVRGKKGESPAGRVEKVLKYLYGKDRYKMMSRRVRIVEGDIDRKNLATDKKDQVFLTGDIDEIYHSAAVAEFKVPIDRIRKINVGGTDNVMKFALEARMSGRLKNIYHISTTFVAGTKAGTFSEKDLDVGQKFNNTYEQTKCESEILAHEYIKRGLNITIFRPSILTGDSVNGRTSNFKMLYQPLHFFAAELFDTIPADRSTGFNLIPVDSAADAILTLANKEDTSGKTYHIANSNTIEAGHFIDLASDFFEFKKPEFIPIKYFNMKDLSSVQRNLIEPYIPYFNYKTDFDSSFTRNTLAKHGFHCPKIDDKLLIRLFKFCVDSGFIKPKRHYVTAG